MVNASWAKTALNDLEATARTQNHIACWDANVLECEVAMSMGGIIIAINGEHSVDSNTWRVCRNQDDRLLLVWVLVGWITLTHHNVDLASWVASAT
jgi:hypothetical protein